MKKFTSSHVFRVLCVVVALAVAIVVIMATSGLNGLRFDISSDRIMTVSQTAADMIRAIDSPVDIYYITEAGTESLRVSQLAANMAACNPLITAHVVAPSDPIVGQLSGRVSTPLANDSVVVASDKRAVAFAGSELYQGQIDQALYYQTQQVVYTKLEFIGERQIVHALRYVTSDDMPVVYALTGHGEMADDGTFTKLCFDAGLDYQPLTLDDSGVPDDAAVVLVLCPTQDMTTDEVKALKSYLGSGGHMLLTTDYTAVTDNLNSLTAYYGMKRVPGVIFDTQEGYILSADYPMYLYPIVIDMPLRQQIMASGVVVLAPLCESIDLIRITRPSLTTTQLLGTADHSYLKSGSVTTLAREEGDQPGPFIVGASAYEDGLRLTWIASSQANVGQVDNLSKGGNRLMFRTILNEMAPAEADEAASLPGVSMMTEAPQFNVVLCAIILIALPLICLIIGFARRRKYS